MKKHHEPFGLHLMIDAYDCSPKSLNDTNLIYKILDELPDLLGMKKLMKPYIVYAEGNNKRDPGGWSGFVMIQESHVSIHTFIKRRFVTTDVYSCKHFDTQKAIDYFKKTFHTEDIEFYIEERGKKYPPENID
ncbi:S-adenosylmethionine decarboxylase proenzyme [Candidatus Roizmanbacteria bacterium RIFCSPHIGHO2_01_FULL_39_8]|uniref:S-adenosylmethionine decarboxylase proenzyme n=3 Tax=Candidatus Roizmaniibacteriota TaxID=1752723 RepID=A0A1F7GU32_9BACT|nr:MAG: S-adenosylmethionine decarboxylase proenzyme [Candidatus Roizmanbacteria bacterium RIFCSPHIGHO2_01_FULL_39_8]OGK25554.1 MAG: S-adenosylmethionine decarboxylase proenzyme [Candidatus Roizmanbacteria bacterium RIFCSPHIGHO2_02_FULL_39_9]OGK34933.1 MAG: S-adenosylmethionine decarboxylase proenzyme [Candidatus Roizmanbacteria bacterium RIFCSPHIGHO2_12_FULL_39_8]